MCLFIAAVPRTVSERTQCRHVMPLAQESVSSDPAPRRSGSPPRSSAGELETDQGQMNEMTLTIEWIELEKEGVGIRACENKHRGQNKGSIVYTLCSVYLNTPIKLG